MAAKLPSPDRASATLPGFPFGDAWTKLGFAQRSRRGRVREPSQGSRSETGALSQKRKGRASPAGAQGERLGLTRLGSKNRGYGSPVAASPPANSPLSAGAAEREFRNSRVSPIRGEKAPPGRTPRKSRATEEIVGRVRMGKRVLTQMTTRIMPRRAAPGTRAAIGVQPPAVKPSLALFALLVVAVSSGAACKRQIGDDCKTATDCDPSGARACDLSQPGGYCTIQGCNETTCPSEATCIRYFPAHYLTKPCNPAAEDRLPTDAGTDADVDAGDDAGGGRAGLRNDCAANEICLS